MLWYASNMSMTSDDSKIFEKPRIKPGDYLKITILGFALNSLWNPMSTIIMPLLVLNFIADAEKNSYLGLITFIGLFLAILVQPVAGAFSDRSSFKWGRRRPFILIGSLFSIIFLMSLGLADSFIALLIIYCFLQISTNVAHGPWQGLIPDIVPENRRGVASAVKGIVEILGAAVGISVAGYFLSMRFNWEGESKLYFALGAIAVIITGAMVITILLVRESHDVINRKINFFSILRNTFRIDINTNQNFVFFIISRLLFLMPLLVLRTFGLYFLRDVAGVSDPVAVASDLMIAVVIALLIVIYPAGYLADKLGRRIVVAFSAIIGVMGFFILLSVDTYFFIMLAGVLVGAANGCFMSANWALATDLAKRSEEARYLGLTNIATAGATALAAAAGPLMDIINNFTPGLGYYIVLSFCIVCLLASAVLVLKIKPMSHQVI